MSFRIHTVVVVPLVAILCLAFSVIASEQEQQQPAMTPEMQAEMEMWMELAQPGEHHQHLAKLVGTWQGKVLMWMAPGTEPMVDASTAEVKSVLGGRFLDWTHTGNFQGMPFAGRSIEGYNNGDKRYESIWFDNFGTLMLNYTGSCSDDGKLREMKTQFTDPMTGGMIDYRSVFTLIDDDHFTFVSYINKDGEEFKNMEITYLRK